MITPKKYLVFLLLISSQLITCATCNNATSQAPPDDGEDEISTYRTEMREFVQDISAYAKNKKEGFYIIPQNGEQLLTQNGQPRGMLHSPYLNAIDGHGREDLLYGYRGTNRTTPDNITAFVSGLLDRALANNKTVLITDYTNMRDQINRSYSVNQNMGYISFAAPQIQLDVIPDYPAHPINENSQTISQLAEVQNFLYLINPHRFDTKEGFISTIQDTNYDLLIMDYFFNGQEFTSEELAELRKKKNGGTRLLISYLSIGEAEDYRYYWQDEWENTPPEWLAGENQNFPGNYKVRYWMPEWQQIIYGSPDAYLDKILSRGFDGVYLDIIDAFEYFEE